MRLKSLRARGFRNLVDLQLSTDAPLVLFHGENGQGKTNLLEAIYLLATLKSFRTRKNRELVQSDCETARLEGLVEADGLTRQFSVDLSTRTRKGQVDGKAPRDLPTYFQGIRAVLFAPEHLEIIRGQPERRRRFVDRAVFTARPAYLSLYRDFRHLLNQKSALLRSGAHDPLQLDVLDAQLAHLGARLSLQRSEILAEMEAPFREMHALIAEGGVVDLGLRSCLGEGDLDQRREAYLGLLSDAREEECRREMNLVGPQRDDLRIRLDDKPSRAFASQGQARSLVLALKLAELCAAQARAERPLFLLDDLGSELDRGRRERLVRLLEQLEVQCFITSTDPDLLRELEARQVVEVEVVEGQAIEASTSVREAR